MTLCTQRDGPLTLGSRSDRPALCPRRDVLRTGVGMWLGYAPSGARAFQAPQRCRPTESGGHRGWAFGSPADVPHSMQHTYSVALEYARSACWGDCRSIMLCGAEVTHGDLGQARGVVSAGSDGVSSAGASSSA